MRNTRPLRRPLAALLLLAACSAGPRQFQPHHDAFFDPQVFQELALGETSPDRVRKLLGPPYLESRSGADRILWVYDFNPTRQLVLYFSGEVLVEKGWTLSYPNPIHPERIFEARPELQHLRERPSD